MTVCQRLEYSCLIICTLFFNTLKKKLDICDSILQSLMIMWWPELEARYFLRDILLFFFFDFETALAVLVDLVLKCELTLSAILR